MEDHIRALCKTLIETDENSEEYRTVVAELRSGYPEKLNEYGKE